MLQSAQCVLECTFPGVSGSLSMGYYTSHPCFQRGGASMSHVCCGSLVSGALRRRQLNGRWQCIAKASTDELAIASSPSSARLRSLQPTLCEVELARNSVSSSSKRRELQECVDHLRTEVDIVSSMSLLCSKNHGCGLQRTRDGCTLAETRTFGVTAPRRWAEVNQFVVRLQTGRVSESLSPESLAIQRRLRRHSVEGSAISGLAVAKYESRHDRSIYCTQGMASLHTLGSQPVGSTVMDVAWRSYSSVTKWHGQANVSKSSRWKSEENEQRVKSEGVPKAMGNLLDTFNGMLESKKSMSLCKPAVVDEMPPLNREVSVPALEPILDPSLISGPVAVSGGMDPIVNGDVQPKKFVVVVESPVKAKTIEKYLGAEFLVLASHGHVRDLAARAGSVRPDDDYTMVWEVPEDARPHVSRIGDALKSAKCLVLASDPDREGEAIAWHVSELLKAEGLLKKKKIKVLRVTFNEITKNAVLKAMQSPRDICMTLVTAYLARRAIDYLIGFALSPVLWRKLPGSRSAGRVQSAALSLVCQRECEIEEFVPREYWTLEAHACCETGSQKASVLLLRPTYDDGKKLEQFSLLSEKSAKVVADKIISSKIKVSSVKESVMRRNPPKPYITSTLQQDAQVKLGFGTVKTMTLAQKLYEGVKLGNEELTGLITYMRTDGLQLSKEAVQSMREVAAKRYGEKYVPSKPHQFDSKVKNAQEAHEAIRPTDVHRLPLSLCDVLDKDALALYSLIWTRSMACQMEQAVYNEISVEFTSEDDSIKLRASSSSVSFPGFMAALQDKDAFPGDKYDGSSEEAACDDVGISNTEKLPQLQKGDMVVVKTVKSLQHFTHPPPRFSEGSLVKTMEEIGIGRPSTYVSTLRILQLRKYVKIDKHRIFPEIRGRMLTAFLSHYFPNLIDCNFTANFEEQLDEVSRGRVEWKDVLKGFWPDFHADISTVMKIPIQQVVDLLQETFANQLFRGLGDKERCCPSCEVGRLTLKLSRYGSGYFFGCDTYPHCRFTTSVLERDDKEDSLEEEQEANYALQNVQKESYPIGVDPSSGLEVTVKNGPFSYYIQVGPDGKNRRCFRVPEGLKPTDITIQKAVQLMKYPIILDKHPEDGEPVWVGIGKHAFYVRHRNLVAGVPEDVEIEDMNLEKAIELLKGDHVTRRGRKRIEVLAADRKSKKKLTAGISSAKKSSIKNPPQKSEEVEGKRQKKAEVMVPCNEETQNTQKMRRPSAKVAKECGQLKKESTSDLQEENEVEFQKGKKTLDLMEIGKEKIKNEIPRNPSGYDHSKLRKESAVEIPSKKNPTAKRKDARKKNVVVNVATEKKVAHKQKAKTDTERLDVKEKPDQKRKARKKPVGGIKKLPVTKDAIRSAG